MQKHLSIFNFLIYILLSLALTSMPISAAVSYRSAASASSTTTSLAIKKPASTKIGDVMIAAISTTLDTRIVTKPDASWILIIPAQIQTTSVTSKLSTYYKVATTNAANPVNKTYTWTITGTGSAAGMVSSFIGVDQTTPIKTSTPNIGIATAFNSKTQTPTSPSLTPGLPYGMLVTIHEMPSSLIWSPPTGMTAIIPNGVSTPTPTASGGISMGMNRSQSSPAPNVATGSRAVTDPPAGLNRDPSISQSIFLRPYINPLHHFRIRHDGNGLTCAPENIYVKACSNDTCTILYNTDITVTPSSPVANTTWVPTSGKITANAELTLQLTHTVAEPVTLDISPQPPGSTFTPSNVDVCTDLLGNAKSCAMTFYHGALTYSVPTQTSCATPSDITIRAEGTDGSLPMQACGALITNPGEVITFTFSPAPSPNILLNGIPFTSSIASQDVTLNFDASGNSTFTLAHDNAGQFTLAAVQKTDSSVLGSSTFVFKPHSFFLQAYYDNAGVDVDINNATAAGDPKWKASDNFRFRLRGQCAGTPGIITTNYVPTNAELQVELALPVSGANNNLTLQGTDYLSSATASPTWHNISTKFANGAVTDGTNPYADAAFHEVGVLNLHVRDTNYLGATIAAAQTPPLTVGRFTPHHFDTTVAGGCGSFTYSGQPFGVTATARNNRTPDTTTLNYTGVFAFDTILSNAAVDPIINFNATNTIPLASFSNGTASKSDVVYTFTTKDTVADTIILRANDEGTGSASGDPEGSINIRSGRIRLDNVFGLGLKPLKMPLYVEYYYDNGTPSDTSDDGYVTNKDDSCTTYNIIAGSDVNFTGDLADNDVDQTGSAVANGESNIFFHDPGDNTLGPGSGNDGTVNLFLDNIASWLTYDWLVDCDNNGANDTGACGTASFGIYRGDDRIIHWREVF